MKKLHQPVLLDQVIGLLDPKLGESYLDCTAGYGGHAEAILARLGEDARAVLVDRDPAAVQALRERFGDQAEVLHSDYRQAADELLEKGESFDLILMDLGVSSPQLDQSERGFSFKSDGPLDMRMDQTTGQTAADVVNHYAEAKLVEVFSHYGEERRSKSVARAIVAARPLTTTAQLATLVARVVGSSGEIHPATRVFQALRIEVNQELGQLEATLPLLERLLTPNGRLAIISFHSLEDRLVKRFIETQSKDCICPPKVPICICGHAATLAKLTRKVVTSTTEIANNPRARSAKLRAASKLKPKLEGPK